MHFGYVVDVLVGSPSAKRSRRENQNMDITISPCRKKYIYIVYMDPLYIYMILCLILIMYSETY